MFTKSFCLKASLRIAVLSFLFLGAATHSQPFEDCQEALGVSGGGVSLSDGATTTASKGVDEWESDIIKITVARPGVLVLSGEGTAVQGSLYTGGPTNGSPEMEDSGSLGTAHRPLTVVVRPGEHCVQVTPPAGATGNLRVRATFFDVCLLGPQDDHGDSFLCATEAALGEAQAGEVAGTDQDVFAFELAAATGISVAVTGEPDVSVGLYAEDGTLVTASARGSHSLGAGRYFVRIAGDGGQDEYEMTITANP
jgi:hypothetical protein